MKSTGIIAAVLIVVIVMLLVALLIVWLRSNKRSRSLMNERDAFAYTTSELQRQITSATNRTEGYVTANRRQDKIIGDLRVKLRELQRDHDTMIARYEDELKRTEKSNNESQSTIESLQRDNARLNSEIQAANTQLTREKQTLSEENKKLTKEKKELSEKVKNSITVDDNPKVNDFIKGMEGIYSGVVSGTLKEHINQHHNLFMDSIESGALTKWIRSLNRLSKDFKQKLAMAL